MTRIAFGSALLGTVFFASCDGFWDAISSSSSTTSTSLSSGDFYVLNQTTRQIIGYDISSGTLDKLSGSPYTVPGTGTPRCLAIAPGGQFLYVSTDSGIYLYEIESGGALSLQGSGALFSDPATAMMVSGSWLIDAYRATTMSQDVTVNAHSISSTTGADQGTLGTQVYSISSASVNQMALSPDGTNLFVAVGSGGTMVIPFTTSASNPLFSTATVIRLANNNGSALSVAVDPSNRLFYIGEVAAGSGTSGGLRAFSYSSLGTSTPRSTPSEISGSPFSTGSPSPNAILPEASGTYVYVANGNSNSNGTIAWFTVSSSSSSYSLAADSTIGAGIGPNWLAEDSSDQFILAVSQGGTNTSGGSTGDGRPDLEAFTMSSGALTSNIASATNIDSSEPVGATVVAAVP